MPSMFIPQRVRLAAACSLLLASAAQAHIADHASRGGGSPPACINGSWNSAMLNPDLGPAGAFWSFASGVSGEQQVGRVLYSSVVGSTNIEVASVWSGSAGSWVNLSPDRPSSALATNGTHQVGWLGGLPGPFGGQAACIWNGTPESIVNLHPDSSYWSSIAHGISSTGDQQVGRVLLNINGDLYSRATLWSGTIASRVELHPAGGPTDSVAYAVEGGQQVGYTFTSGMGANRAALWTGTAASYISLHPPGAERSEALATNGSQQVGFLRVSNADPNIYACLWNGTASSWVNLNPTGATTSIARGISGDYQVGNATVGDVKRASIWSGTAASWVDLHQYLPAGIPWRWSEAHAVWTDGEHIRVVGHANGPTSFNSNQLAHNQNVAILWTMTCSTPPPPECINSPWSTTNLNPPRGGPYIGDQAGWSFANGVSGGQQAGTAFKAIWGGTHWFDRETAGYWNGTSGSWVDLENRATFSVSGAFATNGAQQVGFMDNLQYAGGPDLFSSAVMWNGTAESRVNLHPGPLPFAASSAHGISSSGDQQVGRVLVQGVGSRASLWFGTAASRVDLHPAGGQTDSFAYAVEGGQQVGYTEWSGVHGRRAALWHGTAESYISLHPSSSQFSEAFATNGTQQVGYFTDAFSNIAKACLWSGSAASHVSLNPSGAPSSSALGISGNLQAGWSVPAGSNYNFRRACVWSGTAASHVDLHQYLPGGPTAWRASEVRSIWSDGAIIRAAGIAVTLDGGNRAMLWTITCPLDIIITADTPQSFLDSLVIVTGSLIISGDVNIASLSLPNLVQVGGDIIIAGNTALTTVGAPTLKQVDGSIEIDGNPMLGVVDFGALGNIGGSFTVANSDNPQFDFGALGNIGGSFTVADNNNPQFDFGALGNIGGSFTVANSDNPQFDFGALGNIGGSFTVADNNNPQFTLPALEDVGGDFNYGGNAMPTVLVLPSLTTLGGSFIVQGNGALVTLSAPLLDEVPGSVGIDGNPGLGVVDFSGLALVSGDIAITQDGSTLFDLGSLGLVSGDISIAQDGDAQYDFGSLGLVSGDITITQDGDVEFDFGSLALVSGDISITQDGDPQFTLGLGTTLITFPALTSVGGDLTVSTVGQAVHDFANAVVLGNTSISAIGTNLVLLQSAAGSTHVALDGPISGHAITLPQSTFASPTPLTVRWLEPAELEPAPGLDAGSEAVIIDPLAGTFYGFLEPTFIAPAQVTITLDVELLDENTRTQVLNALAANLLTIAVRGDDKGDLYIARALCTIPQPDACIAITLLDDKGQPMDPQSKQAPAYIEFAAIATQFSRWSVVIVTPDCRPDLNNDGNLDFFDITAFLSAFSISDPIADWNADTNFDFFDIVTFLGDFATGCP